MAMSETAPIHSEIGPAAAVEAEVEEAIALCGGDVRAALRATLIANAYLQDEVDRLAGAASAGFARRRVDRRSKGEKEDRKAS
jgi:hypothetical protein